MPKFNSILPSESDKKEEIQKSLEAADKTMQELIVNGVEGGSQLIARLSQLLHEHRIISQKYQQKCLEIINLNEQIKQSIQQTGNLFGARYDFQCLESAQAAVFLLTDELNQNQQAIQRTLAASQVFLLAHQVEASDPVVKKHLNPLVRLLTDELNQIAKPIASEATPRENQGVVNRECLVYKCAHATRMLLVKPESKETAKAAVLEYKSALRDVEKVNGNEKWRKIGIAMTVAGGFLIPVFLGFVLGGIGLYIFHKHNQLLAAGKIVSKKTNCVQSSRLHA